MGSSASAPKAKATAGVVGVTRVLSPSGAVDWAKALWHLPTQDIIKNVDGPRGIFESAMPVETGGRMMQRAPNDPALLQSAAEVYLASNNPAKAAELYERATALDAADVRGRVRLAEVRLAAGDTVRAFKDLEAIAEANPALPAADLALLLLGPGTTMSATDVSV